MFKKDLSSYHLDRLQAPRFVAIKARSIFCDRNLQYRFRTRGGPIKQFFNRFDGFVDFSFPLI